MFTFGDFNQSGQNVHTYELYELPLFLVLGALGGLFGSLFNTLYMKLISLRKDYVNRSSWRRLIEAAVTSMVISVLSFFITVIFQDFCYNLPPDDDIYRENLVQLTCPDGMFNEMATLFFTPGENAIKQLFHSTHYFSLGSLGLFFITYFFTFCWSAGLFIPAGMLIPTLLMGSAMGRLFGQVLSSIFPRATVNAGTYSLIGSAAMLAGQSRMTISLAVILIESTGDIQYGLPLIFTLIMSKFVGDQFTHGLYDMLTEARHWPFLEPEPPRVVLSMTAGDVMNTNIKTLGELCTVGEIYDILKNSEINCFFVVQQWKYHPLLGVDKNAKLIKEARKKRLESQKKQIQKSNGTTPKSQKHGQVKTKKQMIPKLSPIRESDRTFSSVSPTKIEPTTSSISTGEEKTISPPTGTADQWRLAAPESGSDSSGNEDEKEEGKIEKTRASEGESENKKKQNQTMRTQSSTSGIGVDDRTLVQGEELISPKTGGGVTAMFARKGFQNETKKGKRKDISSIQTETTGPPLFLSLYGPDSTTSTTSTSTTSTTSTTSSTTTTTIATTPPSGSSPLSPSYSFSRSPPSTPTKSPSSPNTPSKQKPETPKHYSLRSVVSLSRLNQPERKQKPTKTYGKLVGTILRKHLLVLLKHKAFFPRRPLHPGESSAHLTWDDFEAKYPRYPKFSEIELTQEEKNDWVDLTPYMHRTPTTVFRTAPLSQVYTIFRTLGLRHLPVLKSTYDLVGIITRKSLTERWIVAKKEIKKEREAME